MQLEVIKLSALLLKYDKTLKQRFKMYLKRKYFDLVLESALFNFMFLSVLKHGLFSLMLYLQVLFNTVFVS